VKRTALLIVALLVTPPTAAYANEAAVVEVSEVGDEPKARWPWVLLLAGAATLAASATLGSAARADHASWTSTRDPDLKAQLKDRGEGRVMGAQATAVAGLVALTAGTYFVWTF